MENPNQTARRLERRWAPRFPCGRELEMEWGSVVLRGRIRDISAGGMFIESSDPLWVGAGFSARLKLREKVRVNCLVKRVEAESGMGVAVSLPVDDRKERYQDFVRSLARAGS